MAEYTINKIVTDGGSEVMGEICKEAKSAEEANEWWEKHSSVKLEIGTYQLTKWNRKEGELVWRKRVKY